MAGVRFAAPLPDGGPRMVRRAAGALLLGVFVVGFEAVARAIELVRRVRGYEPTVHG